MDVQAGITDRLPEPDAYLKKLQAAIDYAHSQRWLVIFVVVGFRPSLPELSSANRMFKTMSDRAKYFVNPAPALAPSPDDVVVTKRRVSAFSGSDLEVILRAQGVTHLVLTGIATSGVVLSTLREASDKDFQLTVLSDLCADQDAEVQSVLTTKVFPRQAEVMTAEQWQTALAGE
jgi:nicotinamidase-related amidase